MEGENARCASSVKTQNEAVDRLLKAGEDRARKAAEALRTAQAESAALGTRIETLRATKAPESPECAIQAEAARKLIADEVRGRK